MAEAALKVADKTDVKKFQKATKFRELGIKRMDATLKKIEQIGKLSNRSSYFYTEADVKKITNALRDAIDTMEAKFAPSYRKSTGFSF